jgi:hypothetical protein
VERSFVSTRSSTEAEGEWVVTTQEQSDILAQLEAPFATEEIKWRVTHTTKDAKKGAVIPYADQRAYTDRLNKVLTPSGWTREYIVTTVSNISRMVTRDKTILTGKILITCIVTIPGVGAHTGSGEEWADNENAMTAAEAQAFKRACSYYDLGRYFYDIAEQWVELDDYKRPKQTPKLSGASTPGQRQQQGMEYRQRLGDKLEIGSFGYHCWKLSRVSRCLRLVILRSGATTSHDYLNTKMLVIARALAHSITRCSVFQTSTQPSGVTNAITGGGVSATHESANTLVIAHVASMALL